MTTVFDLIGIQNRDHGERGIARYIFQLASTLERRHPGLIDEYWIHSHLPVPGILEPLINPSRLRVIDSSGPIPRPSERGIFIAGSIFEGHESVDRILPPWSRGPGWRSVGILYDLIPLRFPEIYLRNRRINTDYRTRVDALGGIDHLLSISKASAADATELIGIQPERMSVIWAGADSQFTMPAEGDVDPLSQVQQTIPSIDAGFVMFPCGIEPRKNVDRMIEAYAQLPRSLRSKHQLVLVCRITDTERIALERRASELGLDGELIVTGFVPDELLVLLYQAAHIVVFPALYEGFGLPVLEAMQCGAPVICSDSSSLVEIQVDPTARFDPTSISAIRDCLQHFLEDEGELDRLRNAPLPPFSWERAADRTASAIRNLRTARPSLSSTLKERLAIISPLPPQPSGIANYAARLIEPLLEHFDITVFTDPPTESVQAISDVAVAELGRFEPIEQIEGAFDHVLYMMGNSEFHIGAFNLLERRRGIVQMHDVRMTGLFNEMRRRAPNKLPPGGVGELISQHYPNRYRSSVEQMEEVWPETAHRFGCYLSRPVTTLADAVIVHSNYAAKLLALEGFNNAEVLFDHPFDVSADLADRVVRRDQNDPVIISSFGIIAPSKQPERLIEAFSKITDSNAELRFIGWGDDGYLTRLREMIQDLAIVDRVVFCGRVSDDVYHDLLKQTTVAVQLRAGSNGESSGTVAETLAYGIPTIVCDTGAQSELPCSVVRHVDGSDDATVLTDALDEMIQRPDIWERYQSEIVKYTEKHTYEDAARRLADFLKRHRQHSQRNVAPWRNAAPCY